MLDGWAVRWRPLPDETAHAWAERTASLTQYTENKGPYSTSLTPFVREWLECYRDPSVREVTKVTGSQVAKTQTDLVGLSWWVKHRRIEALWVTDTGDNARSISETRWDDLVEHNDEIRALKPIDPDRYKKTEQQFTGCTVFWAGSNSPGKLASKPVGLIVLDETEKYPMAPQQEAPSADLAEQRVKSYSSAKKIRSSTPKLESGYIWQKYQKGDMRRYFVPCPHCRGMITLEWGGDKPYGVKWDQAAKENGVWNLAKVMSTGHYICQKCGGRIEDSHKTAMLRGGEWRPTNPNAMPGHRSYHISSLYSPWRSTGFGALAAQFCEAKDSLLGLQGFINGVLAEPWTNQAFVDPISMPEGTYSITEIVKECDTLALSADVQLDHFWAVVRGHGAGLKSRLHFAEKVQSFADLEALHRKYGIARNMAGIDCGYDRNGDVYKFAAKHQWYALRGDAPREGFYRHMLEGGVSVRRIYSPAERIDAFLGTAGKGFCLRVFFAKDITDDILQQLLLRVAGNWEPPRDAPQVWLEQINARRKLPKKDPLTGDVSVEWCEVVRKWDHLRDAECMQVVLAAMRGFLRDIEPGGPTASEVQKPEEKPPAEPPKVLTLAELRLQQARATTAQTPMRRQPFVPRRGGGFVRGW